MPTKKELFDKLLNDYEHVVRKLMSHQSNAYHLLDNVDLYKKEWEALEEAERTPSIVPSEEVASRKSRSRAEE